MLRIFDFDGLTTASTPEEVERALVKRYENDANAFWLLPTEQDFPAASLVVKGDLASLTYTAKDDEAGYRSDGGVEGLIPGQQSMFYAGHNEPEWVLNDSIIRFDDAVTAAKELLESSELPKSVKWFEL